MLFNLEEMTLPALDSDLARELTKDPYAFDFTQLAEAFTEAELKAALVANIENFLLELGNGFAFLAHCPRTAPDAPATGCSV